uniref:tRNA (Adenine-N1)-methyltransferase n=1 Tax=Ignisphaera aggregans TaxID=334771 RepID=A0A7C2VDH4_9CREN
MTSGLSTDNYIVSEGDKALLYFDSKRRWIVRIERDKAFSSDRGKIQLSDVIGVPYGSKIRTSVNFDAYVMKPLLIDYIEKGLRRATQVIYPKDQGLIVLLLDISPGKKVLEVGVGTGSTTIVLANIVRPLGHVYGYDVREEFIKIAKRNIAEVGLLDYVTLKVKDAREGIDEQDLDAAVVDIGDPWNILDNLYNALRPSAPVVFFLPSMNQVMKLFNALEEFKGFKDLRCYEVLAREIKLSAESIRPASVMVGHTGYIFFARKVFKG